MSSVSLRLLTASVLSAAALSATAAAPANAGEYHVYGCTQPDGSPAGLDGWKPEAQPMPPLDAGVTDPSWGGWLNSCAAPFGSYGVAINQSNAGQHVRASLLFAPGDGLAIVAGRMQRTIANSGPGSVTAGLFAKERDSGQWVQVDAVNGPGTMGDNATQSSPANAMQFPRPAPSGLFLGSRSARAGDRMLPAGPSTALTLHLSCYPSYPDSPPCSGSARYQISHSDLTLRDDVGPALTVLGGSLITDNKVVSRNLAGVESITVAATDVGIGVGTVRAELGGKRVDAPLISSTNKKCNFVGTAADNLPAATLVRPCPSSGAGTALIDTKSVPDGRHQLRVLAVDGSGAETEVINTTVLVRNTNIVGPGSPEEFRGAPNGGIATDAAIISATWPSTAKAPSKSKTVQRRCKKASYRKTHRIACEGRPARGDWSRSWSRTRTAKLTGRLTDTTGKAIANAAVDLGTTSGSTSRSLGTVTTDNTGTFSALVPRSANQTITASWRARLGDTSPVASTTATLRVLVGSTFKASNLRAGARAKFTGRVMAGDLAADTAIRLQWKSTLTGKWATFETTTTNDRGRWEIKRRMTQRAKYSMRVVVEDHASKRFAGSTGRSKTVRVR